MTISRKWALIGYEAGLRQTLGSEFDAWLQAHDAEVAAGAWDECFQAVSDAIHSDMDWDVANPYRGGEG